ncbi:uncharacterized protein LOC125941628 isoform X4 [Dermacentor silvarum]|uniref:uncharacterized protein LOC125941628 isoform X4 n=1 Tax=Dermacentor silvarum TaxID=543639 RepID=UPI002100D69C|nr:uncharacterized protein LOC125941628 isoform X4 [Dermacentor silvarum]
MKLAITLGLISLILHIVPSKGISQMVNLTEEAVKYISKTNEGIRWVSFKDKPQSGKESPVTVTAKNPVYDDGCEQPPGLNYTVYSDYFFWYIYQGIWTPFEIFVNFTVLYKGQKNHTFRVNLSHASYIVWDPENLTTPLPYTKNFSEKKCNFAVEVTFNGKFSYEVERPRGDNPKQNSVGVGLLENKTLGLVKHNDTTLAYNVSGVFQHTVIYPD